MPAPSTRQPRQRPAHYRALAVLIGLAAVAGGFLPATPAALAEPLQLAQASNGMSLAQATQMVRERTGGQVLRAETRREQGRTVHRIRVLTDDGRVQTWRVDAETGRVY